METWQARIGLLSGILSLSSYVPYILSILRGKTRPNRVTWGVWATIGLIIVSSYHAAGATHTMWVPLSQLISQSIIALLAFKFGIGGWQRLDRLCLGGAALSLLLWWQSGSPTIALLINIWMDILGALPTLRKMYQAPYSEDLLSWSMFLGANTLNLFALEQWSFSLIAYPMYLFGLSITIVVLLTRPIWAKVRGS